ncbi:MAG: response regulator transcription factor [Solirubrobacteraceae bacterium]
MVTRGNPSVVVLDEDELFRSGLVALLQERGIRVLSEACSASDAVAQASEQRPDVVLIDLSVDGMSGIAATRQLTSASPPVRVVVLTAVATDQHVIDALLAGASGYLLKDAPIEQIIEGIVAAVRGESMLSPRIAGRLVARLREPARGASALPAAEFTERQLEVLRLVARGISNQEIAKALFLSEHTVKNHVSTILVKLGADNRIQAAVRAVRARIVE